MIETKNNNMTLLSKDHESPFTHVQITVKIGSCSENPEEEGIAHFLEHLAFKGTTTRSYEQLINQVADLGIEHNACTDYDSTIYYMNGLGVHTEKMVELLSDSFFNSTFPEEEIEKERGVILSELQMREDDPLCNFYDKLMTTLYPRDRYLSHKIIGTRENIKRFKKQDFLNFRDKFYTNDNIVVTMVGRQSLEESKRLFEKSLVRTTLPSVEVLRFKNAEFNTEPFIDIQKDREQPFFLWIREAISNPKEPKYWALRVLTDILGGGMHSVLFNEVREKRGLCYSISSALIPVDIHNLFDVSCESEEKNISEIEKIIQEIFENAKDKPFSQEIINRSKSLMLTSILRGTETSRGIASRETNGYLHGMINYTDTICNWIKAVTAEDIQEVAKLQLVKPPKFGLLKGE